MAAQMIYDAIVIGVGSMGSAASYYLAEQGLQVLGIDQYTPPHLLGSHTGQSRIIRMAYFEHPDYVPLLKRSYELWKNLETKTHLQHFYKTGLQYYGPASGSLIEGVICSATKYNLEIQKNPYYNAQLTIPENMVSIYEPNAGYIIPEKTISSFIDLASQKGARFHYGEKVLSWKSEHDIVKVNTNQQSYCAKKIIITSGAWSKQLIPNLPSSLNVTKQSLFWVRPKNVQDFSDAVFPCWNIQDPNKEGLYYGFPIVKYKDELLIKLAHHVQNITIDPDRDDRKSASQDQVIIQYALDTFFPNKIDKIVESSTCLYTNSKDENFIIDFAAGFDHRVVYACGFSGHGFKFVPVIGKILAELAIYGKTDSPIEFLAAQRFH